MQKEKKVKVTAYINNKKVDNVESKTSSAEGSVAGAQIDDTYFGITLTYDMKVTVEITNK